MVLRRVIIVPILLLVAGPVVSQVDRIGLNEPLAGIITSSDGVVSTPALDQRFKPGSVMGQCFRLRVSESGFYRIKLWSYFFDAYLVVRDADSRVLAEDDNGGTATHARLVVELRAERDYGIQVCALKGAVGDFVLQVYAGRPESRTPRQDREATINDARTTVAVREERLGKEHPSTAESLNRLAILLAAGSERKVAGRLFRRALAIREKALGPRHPLTTESLENLAAHLFQEAQYAAAEPLFRRALAIRMETAGPDHLDTAAILASLSTFLETVGKAAEAEPYARRALEIRRKALGPDSPEVAASLSGLARLLQTRGALVEAEQCARRALAIQEKSGAPDSKKTAKYAGGLAAVLNQLGKYEEAEALFRREQAICRKAYGLNHPETANSVNNLAVVLEAQGDSREAEKLHRLALSIREKVCGAHHPETAQSLVNLSFLLGKLGRIDEAEENGCRALAINRHVFGERTLEVGRCLGLLAGLMKSRGRMDEAEALLRKVLAIREKRLGPVHPGTADGLRGLAQHLTAMSRYPEAERLARRAVEIYEETLEKDDPLVAWTLNDLAGIIMDRGRYGEAERGFRRALALNEKALGPEDPNTLRIRNNLAGLLVMLSRYREAEPLFRRILPLYEEVHGANHEEVAQIVNNLGFCLMKMGQFEEAERLLRRALSFRRAEVGLAHAATVQSLSNLGNLHIHRGEYNKAERILKRVVALGERVFGHFHDKTADGLNALGALYFYRQQFVEAEPLYRQALEIREKVLGPKHPYVADSLNNLGAVYYFQGRLEDAGIYARRAAALRTKVFGRNHPQTAESVSNLALVYREQDKLDEALRLNRHALASLMEVLGPAHPTTAKSITNLAFLHVNRGELDEAWRLFHQSVTGARTHLESLFGWATEQDRFMYLEQKRAHLENLLSLATDPDAGFRGPSRLDQAYEALLAWKGLVFRSTARQRERARKLLDPGLKKKIEQLRDMKAELSSLVFLERIPDPPGHRERVRILADRCRALERDVMSELGDKKSAPASGIKDVAASLPENSVLLDFHVHLVRKWATNPGADGDPEWTPQLSVWILKHGAQHVHHVSLGAASRIEKRIRPQLVRLSRPRGGSMPPVIPPSRDIRAVIWDPLASEVGNADTVYISPDLFVATLPFGALQREDESFLVEKHQFVYLQDAPGLAIARPATEILKSPSLLLAGGIEYGRATKPDSPRPPSAGKRPLEARIGRYWKPLPEAGIEVTEIQELHNVVFDDPDKVRLLRGKEATEDRLKSMLPEFQIIHLATHGFFRPSGYASLRDSVRQLVRNQAPGLPDVAARNPRPAGYLPGSLSGLVCASANLPEIQGEENGLLTAEEVAWLDLGRARLVVLSACQTGLGEARSGEGLMSLRRAFRLAGARTVISSIWKVPDDATRELMVDFYGKLWKVGNRPLAALHEAQLTMLARNRKKFGDPRPWTWGAFVLSGDW